MLRHQFVVIFVHKILELPTPETKYLINSKKTINEEENSHLGHYVNILMTPKW